MADTFGLPRPNKIDYQSVPREDTDTIAKLEARGYTDRYGTAKVARMVRHREAWDLFEQEILIFLADGLKLDDAKGGPLYYLGGHQIDACGGLEGVFLVVDAKYTEDPTRGGTRAYVDDLARKTVAIRRDVSTQFPGIYEGVCFAVFTNAEADAKEIQYALDHGVFLVDGRYYPEICKGLHSAIGPVSRYQILRDFLSSMDAETIPTKWKAGTADRVRVPALRVSAPRQVALYSCFMRASDLLRLGYVARLESRRPGAYQRLLKKDKLAGVAEFIDDDNVFKNNIVVGLHSRPRFVRATGDAKHRPSKLAPDVGHLYIEDVPASVWVIDGQHRLYGYARLQTSEQNQLLPVMAMFDGKRDQSDQALTFVEINKYQTPITPDVLWALYSDVQPATTEGLISAAVRDLAAGGVFKDRIYVPDVSRRSRSGYNLYMNNVCKGIVDRHLLDCQSPNSLVEARSHDGPTDPEKLGTALVSVLNDYFGVVYKAADSSTAWRDGFIFTNNGFNVLLRVLSELLFMLGGKYAKTKANGILIVPLRDFFAENAELVADFRLGANGEAGRADVASRFIARINQHDPVFGHAYLRRRHGEVLKSPESELLRQFERLLRELIGELLSQKAGSEWRASLPRDVLTAAEAKKKANQELWPWASKPGADLVDYFDFTDYARIIRAKWNWFREVFGEQEIVLGKLRELEPMRNDVAHSRNLDSREYQRLAMYLDDFRRSVEKWRSGTGPGGTH